MSDLGSEPTGTSSEALEANPPARRVIGVDLGSKRIGVAVSDSGGRLATPVATLLRTGDRGADHRALAAVVSDYGAGAMVVGLPLSLSGGTGPAAAAVLAEVEEMKTVIGVPVYPHDERFSTVSAGASLRAQGRRRRAVVDQVAAAVILQSWLDAGAQR